MSIQAQETIHKVWGYDCGYGGPFRPLSLANYFQEAAGDHARTLGIGMDVMFANGRTWMMSRIDIRIDSLPEAGDEVLVRTWPAGTNRLFARRFLELAAADGRILAGALYEYLIVDLEQRRPLRPEKLLDPAMVCERRPPFQDLCPGLQGREEFAHPERFSDSFSILASHRHIDYNGHVNNAHLIDWLYDAVPPGARGSGALGRIKVDFAAEVKQGEEITASWAVSGREGELLSILSRKGEVVARGLAAWLPAGSRA